ncbi:structural maintenance of chromosomes protein 6-like [Ylistrum balloti]|uniref:structural maintenance of chromosomes protein 6-like n=1 Tax=Ylistrum balloti TaxID=509963 RepID=UPI0029058F3F|nr:structural maintenance of chromosomes protein 6-like [Ylistrum balloti]
MSKRKASTDVAGEKIPRKRQIIESDDDEMDQSQDMDLTSRADFDKSLGEADIGIVEKVNLRNFMCHQRLDISLGPHVNFIMGRNGSGKSAIITALVVGLGGKANITSRGNTIKSFIKTGKQTAEVMIKLRNRGPDAYKPEEYGNSIIVERKFARDGGSHYKLKSEDGRLISQKREDLTYILDQFNIQVDNPVSILNQETSKNFLNSKSPHDKYKFFLKATQLEQMKMDYSMANEQKEITREIIEKKEQSLPILEKEVLDWERKYKSLTAIKELQNKIKELKDSMAWAFVMEKERGLQPLTKELQQEESRLPKFVQKVEEAKSKVDKCVQRQKDIQEQLKTMSDQVQELRPTYKSAKEEVSEKKKVTRNTQNDLRKVESYLRKVQRDRHLLQEKIKEIQKSAQRDYESERKMRETKLKQKEDEVSALKAQQTTTEHQQSQYRQAITLLKQSEYSLNADRQNMDTRERLIKKDLQNLCAAKKDNIRRFGAYMPTLLQHIEERCRRNQFHRRPVGPIGSCFKLTDMEWAFAVERCLGNLIHAFCCHDHHDEAILEKIFDDVCPERHRPSIIVSAFKDRRHDISRGRVTGTKYKAVVDVLEMNDPVTFNCLIDQRGVECILLIKDNRIARDVMDPDKKPGPPKYSKEAFTADGDQLYCHPSLRYYSSRGGHARFLSTNVEEEISRYQEELHILKKDIGSIEQKRDSLNEEIRTNKIESNKTETQLTKIAQKIRILNDEIQDLKSIEDPEPVDVETLEEEVQTMNDQIKIHEEQLMVKSNIHSQAQQELELLEKKFKEVENQMRTMAEGADPLKDELGHAQNEIEQSKSHKKHYEQKFKEQEHKIADQKKKVEMLEKEIENDTMKAEQICPRKVNMRRSVQNLESEINQITKRIKVEEKSHGNPTEITKTYFEKKSSYKKIRDEVKQFKRFMDRLEKVMVQRQQQYSEFRKSIAFRAKHFFIILLSNRKYNGKMTFNHPKETLEISVQPNSTNGDGAKDMRSLSGGERSFSTVCFILALWDAMESPFRCLDEFDVFMDMVNRRISMDLMLKVAKQQLHRQFIFMTPQNMSELGIKVKGLNIFRMPDPDRGQSVLPFEPLSRQQEEEDEN